MRRRDVRDLMLYYEFDTMLAFCLAAKKCNLEFTTETLRMMIDYMAQILSDRRRNSDYYFDAIAVQVKKDVENILNQIKEHYELLQH